MGVLILFLVEFEAASSLLLMVQQLKQQFVQRKNHSELESNLMKQKFVLELQHKIHVNGIQPQEELMVLSFFIGKILANSIQHYNSLDQHDLKPELRNRNF